MANLQIKGSRGRSLTRMFDGVDMDRILVLIDSSIRTLEKFNRNRVTALLAQGAGRVSYLVHPATGSFL
jgi:hypothetical protein